MLFSLVTIVATGLTASLVQAQTSTSCNPLNETCPSDPALSTSYTWNLSSNSFLDSTWNITNGQISYTNDAAQFSINQPLDSPTIRSTFYIFFGRLEYHVMAGPGHGVISSVVLQSDDLDEIDWEWVGSNTNQVQTNYFSQGQTINGSGAYFTINGDTTTDFHNYTTVWTKESLEWWCDGQLLRTLEYATNTTAYPQTPMTVKVGIWPGGDPSGTPGRIAWAGGPIDYNAGPYNMYVSQISAQDYSTGASYTYNGPTGSWESINIVQGNSAANTTLHAVHETLSQKFNNLPSGAKIAIFASAAGVAALALIILVFCCVKQRRIGRREYNIQESKFNQERTEMMNLQAEWRQRGYIQSR